MTAALQPFMQESGALAQVAIAQVTDQDAAAFGAFVGNLLGAAIEIVGDVPAHSLAAVIITTAGAGTAESAMLTSILGNRELRRVRCQSMYQGSPMMS